MVGPYLADSHILNQTAMATSIPMSSPASRSPHSHAHSPARPSPLSSSYSTTNSNQMNLTPPSVTSLSSSNGMKKSHSLLSLAKLSLGGGNKSVSVESPKPTEPAPELGPTARDIATHLFPGLLLGTLEAANNREFLEREGVTHVLSVAGDLSIKGEEHYPSLKIQHFKIPALDNGLWSMSPFLRAGSEWIEAALEPRYSSLESPSALLSTSPTHHMLPGTPDSFDSGRSGSTLGSINSSPRSQRALADDRPPVVLVHCLLGRSRSPTMVAGHLITLARLRPSLFLSVTENQLALECGPNEILDWLYERREGIKPNNMFVKNLHAWCGKMDVVAEGGWDALAADPRTRQMGQTMMPNRSKPAPVPVLNRTMSGTGLSQSVGSGSVEKKGLFGKVFGGTPKS